MTNKIIAIGLDCPNNEMFFNWIDQGLLPNLASLRDASSVGVLTHDKLYSNQNSWIPFLTGRNLDNIDYWISTYKPKSYENYNHCLYNLTDYQPFYAVGDRARIVMFDLPVAINEGVEGTQVVGWASELNETFPESLPQEMIGKIVDKYGCDPKLDGALEFYNPHHQKSGVSYRVPSAYDIQGLEDFKQKILQTTATRGAICRELMDDQPWDLFISVFSEIHVGGHTLWHLSQDHPLSNLREQFDKDPLLEIYQAVDKEIGLMLEQVDASTNVVLYSVDSLVSDCLENSRSLFLPEFLYRLSFPGKAALAEGNSEDEIPVVQFDYPRHWKEEIWDLRTATGKTELQSPYEQELEQDTFNWQPTNWYKPVWCSMKAFALPSVADGYIRINISGREEKGIVEPSEFQTTCNEICDKLAMLKDARTGKPMVAKIVQVRTDPFEQDAKQSPADLIVLWQEDSPTDVVESPDIGRIGPVPFFRPGGHQKQGTTIDNFFMIRGEGFAPGQALPKGNLEDLPATILDLMGISTPEHMEGHSLLAGFRN